VEGREAGILIRMNYDIDKLDECAMAMLCLTTFEDRDGVRAWKGLSWDVLNRLHEKGWIGDPKSKAKSVVLTSEGQQKSVELFKKHFGSDEA
jgi:hypothetical protein